MKKYDDNITRNMLMITAIMDPYSFYANAYAILNKCSDTIDLDAEFEIIDNNIRLLNIQLKPDSIVFDGKELLYKDIISIEDKTEFARNITPIINLITLLGNIKTDKKLFQQFREFMKCHKMIKSCNRVGLSDLLFDLQNNIDINILAFANISQPYFKYDKDDNGLHIIELRHSSIPYTDYICKDNNITVRGLYSGDCNTYTCDTIDKALDGESYFVFKKGISTIGIILATMVFRLRDIRNINMLQLLNKGVDIE